MDDRERPDGGKYSAAKEGKHPIKNKNCLPVTNNLSTTTATTAIYSPKHLNHLRHKPFPSRNKLKRTKLTLLLTQINQEIVHTPQTITRPQGGGAKVNSLTQPAPYIQN
jgi:hypothetical protein